MNVPAKSLTYLVKREQDREADKRPLDLRLIVRMFGYTRPHARLRNWLFVLVIIRAIQLPTLAWMLGAIINGPIARGDARQLAWWVAGFGLWAALTHFTLHFRQRLALELGEAVVHDLRNAIFEHLQTLSMRYFHKTKLGRNISRITSDADVVRSGVQDVLFVSMVQGGQMIGAAAFMIYCDWKLFCIVLAMAPVLFVVNRFFRRRLSQLQRRVQESFSRVTATLAESVNGMRVTQSFVRQDINSDIFSELVENHADINLTVARAEGVFVPMLEFNTQLFISLLLLIGGYRALHGSIHPAVLVQFIFLAGMFFDPVINLGRMYNQALSSMAGAERVFQLLDTKPDFVDPPDAIELSPFRGEVEFCNLSFAYEPNRPVLQDISFRANPGQTVALVGHTGSGKTSIINLISKFYLPTAGELLIDGHDIRRINADSLHRQMGVVLQVNYLFSGTIMDNIRLGKPGATDEEVIAAAERINVRDMIESLPQGFHTIVGEKGMGLSLGQRQLVCFSRAMLADPRIFILDEATSSIDTVTEHRVQQALALLRKGRTSFIVAHRLSTIRHADLVLVLDHGRIIERGTHKELLGLGGTYAKLYRQFVRSQ